MDKNSSIWDLRRHPVFASAGVLLSIIGLAGVPEDLQNWANWLSVMNWDIARWLLVLVGVLLIIAPIYFDRRKAGKSRPVPETLIKFEEAAELLEKEYGVEFDPQRLRCGSNQPASYLECAAIALFRRAGEGVLDVYGRESVCTDSNKEFVKEPSVIPAEKARQLGDSLLRIQLEPPMTIAGYANEELEYLHGFQTATKQERDQPIRYKDFWVSKQDLARVWGQS